jgi:hypothetical protein
MSDSKAVAEYGTAALNVTGAYFSDYEINGKPGGTKVPHYEDWVMRELAERLQNRREFTVKTHRALFNARVGATVKIQMNNEQRTMNNGENSMNNEQGTVNNGKRAGGGELLSGVINAFSLRYKRDRAFVASFRITEIGRVNDEKK